MIKPTRTAVFLGRPISVFAANPLTFAVARKGVGTEALCAMRPGEEAELVGPLGNAFVDFLSVRQTPVKETAYFPKIALVGGGVGAAPLFAFARELRETNAACTFFAGFKSSNTAVLPADTGAAPIADSPSENALFIATEDGSLGEKGFVTDFFDPSCFTAVFSCGPLPMLRAVYQKCAKSGTPCFVSMEKRMACGVGACLGCRITIKRDGRQSGKRCCTDGPVFDAGELEW
jgi:dihydroorotate dehydrogenase electron transfer subunit